MPNTDKDNKDTQGGKGLEGSCPEDIVSCNVECTNQLLEKGFLLSEELMCLQMICLRHEREQGAGSAPFGTIIPVNAAPGRAHTQLCGCSITRQNCSCLEQLLSSGH